MRFLFQRFSVWIRKKSTLYFLIVVFIWIYLLIYYADFSIFFRILLLPAAIILMLLLRLAVSGLRSIAVMITSAKRVKELAQSHPELAELEKKRGILVGIRFGFFVIFIAIIVLCTMIFGGPGMIVSTFATVCLYGVFLQGKERGIELEFKRIVVLDELNRAFTEVNFTPQSAFPFDEIIGLQMFSRIDKMYGNDYIGAKRGGRQFSRCDIELDKIREFTDKDGKKQELPETIFRGCVFRFELDPPSPARLLVATEGFENLREADGVFKKLTGRTGRDSVETEMDLFNRRFDVYCSDQTAARYMLTPQMIEGILHISDIAQSEFAMLFNDTYLYLFLATPNVDYFELSLNNHRSIKDQQKIVESQVEFMAQIIDNIYFKRAPSN